MGDDVWYLSSNFDKLSAKDALLSLRDCPRLLRRPATHDDCGRLWLAVSAKADVKASYGLSVSLVFAPQQSIDPKQFEQGNGLPFN